MNSFVTAAALGFSSTLTGTLGPFTVFNAVFPVPERLCASRPKKGPAVVGSPGYPNPAIWGSKDPAPKARLEEIPLIRITHALALH